MRGRHTTIMLVLCDFDGTVTTEDVTNVLWDAFGLSDWRAQLLPPYRAGQKTTLELMDMGWRAVDRTEAELLTHARARIGLRAGFEAFADACGTRGWGLHIVSCGLDWYLRAFLPARIPFTSYAGARGETWRVRLPDGYLLPAGKDFKIDVYERLRRVAPQGPTVFIGDGRNDFPVARLVDRVFALQGSTLADLCRADGLPFTEFTDFHTIQADLTAWAASGTTPIPGGQGRP